MRHVVPTACLFLAACGAPLAPAELCNAELGATLEVRGFTHFALTSHGTTACEPDTCCNDAVFAPAIDCPDGADIVIVPSAAYVGSSDPFGCEGMIDTVPSTDGAPPSAECPLPLCRGVPWATAIGALELELVTDPITGSPVRRFAVDSFTVRSR